MQWDDTVDVVVVGSGLAGLSAALAATAHGLRALVLEKGEQAGGGTSYSFGGLWIGNNAIARERGFQDSRDETIAYLRFLGAGYEIEENLLAFVDGSPAALDYFLGLGIPFQVARGVPDHYYDTAPGSKREGRMLEVALISGYDLGDWQHKVSVSPYVPMGATFEEAVRWGGHGNYRNWDAALLAERRERDLRGFGAGLAAQFVKALLARGVPIQLSSGATRLVTDGERVVGVEARQGDRPVRLGARHGVVLSTGGYESNRELVRRYEGFSEWGSMFPATLTGDGLLMATEIGATTYSIPLNMAIFLGFEVPAERSGDPPSYRVAGTAELSFPHTLVVNQAGERFADEAYFQALLNGLRQFDVWHHRLPNFPCYLVFDQDYAEKYSFAGLPPGALSRTG